MTALPQDMAPQAAPPSPGLGHNRPPDPMAPIRLRVEALLANANAWLKLPEITTEEQAAKLEDAYNQVRKYASDTGTLETERKAMNKPLRDEIADNDALFKPLLTALKASQTVLGRLRDGWLRKVQAKQDAERIAAARALAEAQEAARKAAEKPVQTVEDIILVEEAEETVKTATAAASTAMAARPQIKGEFSAQAGSLRTFYSAEIVDLAAAVAHYSPQLRDAVQTLADHDAREHKDALAVPGVKLKTEERGV